MAENTSFTLEQLLQFKGDTPVEGFEAFWRRQYEEAINWKCAYTVEDEIWSPVENTRIYRIRFTSTDGFSIGLWIARPEHSTGGILVGQWLRLCAPVQRALAQSLVRELNPACRN